jgi:hypothetical protein
MKGCAFLYAMALIAILAWTGCQTADPPPAQNLLYVKLDDTLNRYERVLVQIFDRDSTDRLLKKLWDDTLPAPGSDIPAYDMKYLGTDRFIIKVTGFKAGRVALQTTIFYEPPPGHQAVHHDSVPPLVPQNWLVSLKPSVGVLSPAFHSDTLHYQVKMPEGMDSLNFTMAGAYPGVTIQLNGSVVTAGLPTKFIKIGNTPETILVRVTDVSTGTASTREYEIIVFPTLPPGVSLATLTASDGQWNSQFTPDQTTYTIYMFPNQDTISFVATPADPRTMKVTIDGLAALPGLKSQIITVAKGAVYKVPIIVQRSSNSDQGYYQITLDHTHINQH